MRTPHTEPTLTLGELLARVEARGYSVSTHQAKRLRREGLLRCLGQAHPMGTRGSASRYPASEIDQLVLVMGAAGKDKRFDQRRILVAWRGGWVEPAALQGSLANVLDRVSAKIRARTADIDDPGAAADLLLREERDGRVPASTKLMRNRLGGSRKQMAAVMFGLAVLALGGEADWEDHDPASTEEPLELVMERATAVDRMRTEPLFNGRALIPGAASARETITEMASNGLLDVRDLACAFRDLTPAEIAQGFRDAHTVAELALFAEAVEASNSPDAGGLGSARLFEPGSLDATTIATLVRAALLMRRAVPDAAFERTAAALETARGPISGFLELRRALPQHVDVMRLDFDEQLKAVPEPRASEVRRDVSDLLASRPDLHRLLEGR
jgi:hypothetical protein